VVVLCAASIALISIRLSNQVEVNRAQIGTNKQALVHLCALSRITKLVWVSAIKSYSTLPSRTTDQAKLLGELRLGVREINADHQCH
jgi:hypothetical protein